MNIIRQKYFISLCTVISIFFLVIASYNPSIGVQSSGGLNLEMRVIVMLLLAEPHFAMTLPLLYGYRENFKLKPTSYVVWPVIIVFVATSIFFINFELFSIIFLLVNVYHVNRQSRGILILQKGIKPNEATIYEWILHPSVFCMFALRMLEADKWLLIGLFCMLLFAANYIYWKIVCNQEKITLTDLYAFSQGFLVFFPVVVVDNLLLGIAAGVSIHYIQYLTISWPIARRSFGISVLSIIIVLTGYALLTTSALSGLITTTRVSLIVLIPTTLQLLHFYYGGLMWRRSDDLVSRALKSSV